MSGKLVLEGLPSEGDLLRDLVQEGGLYEFVRQFWLIADPACREFKDNWHIGAVCEFLEAAFRRDITRFAITIPPGTGKSTIVSVLWPAWIWTREAREKFLFASHDDRLVLRDAGKMLDVIRSTEYQEAFSTFELGKTSAVGLFTNSEGGLRFSTTPRGKAVGWHSDIQVCDDPLKPEHKRNKLELEKVINWWSGTMATRATNRDTFVRGLIMQRLAQNDLAGYVLDQGYEHLCLPMYHVPNCQWDRGHSLGKLDPRTEPGELLAPNRYDREACDELETELKTPSNVEAQLQQNPTPDSGNYVEKEWLRHTWQTVPRNAIFVQSWDFAFKSEKTSHSRVHGALWAAWDRFYALIDEVGPEHWNYPKSKRAFVKAQKRPLWGQAAVILIEDKAAGSSLISDLEEGIEIGDGKKYRFSGLTPVSPSDPKEVRIAVHSDEFEAGNVLVPTAEVLPSVEAFKDELVAFPAGAYDERVDTTSQALDYLSGKVAKMLNALGKLKGRRK